LNEHDSVARDAVKEPVLLGHAPRPQSFNISQAFRLSDAVPRVSKCLFDQLQHPQRGPWFSAYPIGEVFSKIRRGEGSVQTIGELREELGFAEEKRQSA
jgi:hypothetical protein